jgi:hypothetical protein
MKDSDEAVEKVLAGLRECDAPVGMERRILDALEERAAARARPGWWRLRPDWLGLAPRPVAIRSLAWGVAVAGVFAVAIAIPAIRRLGRGSAQSSARSIAQFPARSVAQSSAQSVARSVEQSHMSPVSAGSLPGASPRDLAESTALPRARVRAGEQAEASEKTDVRSATAVHDGESVAVEEMLAASHPAPPMPLTEQERLLLRIAHKGDPVELAMLDPLRRAARDVEEQTEFQRFFKPRTIEQPTIEQPAAGQPATSQPTTEQPTTAPPTTETAIPGDNE